MPVALAELPADARVRVVPCHPALAPVAADELVAAVAKLVAQWEREGAIRQGACASQADGAFLVMAWVEADAPLSGCRKDMLAKVLAQHGERAGSELLAPPPIVVARDGGPRCLRQGELRSLIAVGAVDLTTPAWNHLAERLGDWSGPAGEALGDIPWLAAAVTAMR